MDQACALIIGQNIGTATSSALAAIGASRTAKRLALAYILFKLIAAAIALALFPITIPPIVRASHTIEGVTLLAAYHTAYNVVGVAVLLPLIHRFTQFVERVLPERGSPLTRCLDPAALATPLAAEEAVRRTVARALQAICGSVGAALTDRNRSVSVTDASDALTQAQNFMSEASGPPDSAEEQERLTRTLHALDHASRMVEVATEKGDVVVASVAPEVARAAQLCAEAMQNAGLIAAEVGALPDDDAARAPTGNALLDLELGSKTLDELQQSFRKSTLGSVAAGALSADDAIARVETIRRLDALAHHAWRCSAYLCTGLERGNSPSQRARRTDDQFLGFNDEEERQTARE